MKFLAQYEHRSDPVLLFDQFLHRMLQHVVARIIVALTAHRLMHRMHLDPKEE